MTPQDVIRALNAQDDKKEEESRLKETLKRVRRLLLDDEGLIPRNKIVRS
jgi:DNA replication protein DnaC